MAVFHVVPKVTNASFFAGLGVVPQPGTPAPEPGYNIQLMVNPTAKVSGTVQVDEAKRTVTVTVDATVENLSQQKDRRKELFVPSNPPQHIGDEYKLLVKFAQGKILFKGAFSNVMNP